MVTRGKIMKLDSKVKELPDPFDIHDTWLEFEPEYSTWLKHTVWVSDGYKIMSQNFYKDEPYPCYMYTDEFGNSRYAKFWYFPSTKLDESNPPNQPERLSEKTL